MTENVRKIFEMLGVEPNEEFKIERYYDGTFYFDQQLILHNKYDYQADFSLQSFINGTNKIIKLPKESNKIKKKLRDLTEQEYQKWKNKNCKTVCIGCPFHYTYCKGGNNLCWIYHKDLYSDKFLNQEIEVSENE